MDLIDAFTAWVERMLAELRHDTQRDYTLAG